MTFGSLFSGADLIFMAIVSGLIGLVFGSVATWRFAQDMVKAGNDAALRQINYANHCRDEAHDKCERYRDMLRDLIDKLEEANAYASQLMSQIDNYKEQLEDDE